MRNKDDEWGKQGLNIKREKRHALFSTEKILLRGDMTEVFIIAMGYKN